MRKALACAALTLLVQPAAASSPDAADFANRREETKTIAGVWTVATWTECGQARDEEDMRDVVVLIDADTMTVASKGDTSRYKYQLRSGNGPQEIDRFTDDANGRRVRKGIIKLDGDTLTLCFTVGDDNRPAEFASRFRRELLVLKRCNP